MIKVEITEHNKGRKYPYIGFHDASNTIVLFTGPSTGISLKGNYVPGTIKNDWAEFNFTILQGTITITQ